MDQLHHMMPFEVTYRVMRVSRVTGMETGRFDGILDGGTISRNQDTSTVESADLEYHGDISEFGADLIRVWADLTWPDGTSESIPLGTFLPDGPQRSVNGPISTTPVSCYGRLRELSDAHFAQPLSVPAGSNPVDVAASICRDVGLEVLPYESCPYRTGSGMTLGMGSSNSESTKLGAVNSLLTMAGWVSARTDPMGRVSLKPYREPTEQAPAWVFTEGVGARFCKEMTDERDWFDVPNQVICVYADQDHEYIGVAVDDSAGPYSTRSRGRVISRTERYSDIPKDKTRAELIAMANDKAAQLLVESRSVIHRLTFTHIYAPIGVGDVIEMHYPTGHVDGRFAVRTQTLHLTAGLSVDTEARYFERT